MKFIDPGKDKSEINAKIERIKMWKRPKQGDPDPNNPKKKLTNEEALILDEEKRLYRKNVWLGSK
jgi:hypothetical protein